MAGYGDLPGRGLGPERYQGTSGVIGKGSERLSRAHPQGADQIGGLLVSDLGCCRQRVLSLRIVNQRAVAESVNSGNPTIIVAAAKVK